MEGCYLSPLTQCEPLKLTSPAQHASRWRMLGMRGDFEGLANSLATLPLWCPLTSPYQPHPPVNVHYLHIYGTRDVSRGVRSTRIRFMWLHFTNFSPCEMTTRSKCATHFQWRPPSVHHVPRCRLPQLLSWATGGLALRLQLQNIRSVLVCTVTVSC